MDTHYSTTRALLAAGLLVSWAAAREAAAQCDQECAPIDLVFVMDTSGSMFDEAASLCLSINQIVVDLGAYEPAIEVNPTILGITQDGSDNPDFDCLTDNVARLLGREVPGDATCSTTLNHLESWAPATAIVATRFPWTPGAIRIIVPISDEEPCNGNPCNDPGNDRSSINNAIELATEFNVYVSPITGTDSNSCVIDLARALAQGTDGTAFSSTDPNADLPSAVVSTVLQYCDCNTNGVPDGCDLSEGTSQDCQPNNIPDECEADCSGDGLADACETNVSYRDCDGDGICNGQEIADCLPGNPTCGDCNSNGIPDKCDLDASASVDCNANLVPDECETDCNANGIADECDLAEGTSSDSNTNGILDDCEECLRDADCQDELFCNGNEECVDSECRSRGDPCAFRGLICDEELNACLCDADVDCDDDIFCDGQEVCVDGVCRSGPPPCDEEVCNESTDSCGDCTTDDECDDGLFCTGVERCRDGWCRSGGDPCLAQDRVCDEARRLCRCDEDADCDVDEECTVGACDVATGLCSYGPLDDDGDGVPDCEDNCLETVAGLEVDDFGCNCAQLDEDEDGVDHCRDECRRTPRGQEVDDDGCSYCQRDEDDDGVTNCDDLCLQTPGADLAVGGVDDDGCSYCQRDDDEDGVANCADLCRSTPPGAEVDEQGCSDVPAGAAVGGRRSSSQSPCGVCGSVGAITMVLLFSALLVLRRSGPLRFAVLRSDR
jgi:hypothetical protein